MSSERGVPQTTRARLRARGAALVLLVGLPVAGLALGATTAGAVAARSSKPTKAQIAKTCTSVADALADGPDPDVDPVGYALAQLRPLRAIKTTDTALATDIKNLVSAFQTVYTTNDKKGTQAAVTKAGNKLDTICPGAF